jgi:hypothetical protein
MAWVGAVERGLARHGKAWQGFQEDNPKKFGASPAVEFGSAMAKPVSAARFLSN